MALTNPQPQLPEHRAEAVCQVTWRYGLHARPASNIARLAATYSSALILQRMDADNRTPFNAKSILGIMSLAAECGALIVVCANGRDATQAVEAMRQLFERSFDMHEWLEPDANGLSVNTVTGATYHMR